jgi:hypothetical protein
MNKWKGILRAGAPLAALLLIAAGARLLPSVLGKEDTEAESATPVLPSVRDPASKQKRKAPVLPKPVDAKTQAALQKVVTGQLTAFVKDDFAQALTYSAPQFQQMYTPDSFRQMVQTGFADLLTYKTLRFEQAQGSADIATMPVYLKAQGGSEIGYLYILHKIPMLGEETFRWCIEGVAPLRRGGVPGPGGPQSGRITNIREM